MIRTLIKDTPDCVGQKVKISGWVTSIRAHGQLVFLDLRDRSGTIQIVGGKDLKDLKNEYVVEINGLIKNRDEKYFNPKLITGKIEMEAENANVLAKSQDLPFDIHQPDLNVGLPALLDYRAASLRNKKIQDIFKVQETLTQTFRDVLSKEDFTEIHVPTIVANATEGGSQVFPVSYFDHKAFLSQSPQFYKQIMVSIFERVFTIAHAYRAEPSVTTRHLTEYISLDAEFGFIDSWTDIMIMADKVIKAFFKNVADKHADILAEYNVQIPKVADTTPVITLMEAKEIIFNRTQRDIRKEPDLDPEGEREICRYALEKFQSDIIFITHFPTKKRPMYAFPDPKDPENTLSFDLIGCGVEWITGGQRVNDYETLKNRIKDRGYTPDDFEIPYLQAFKYGMPPEGGFAIGLERVTQNILGLDNIRQASLYPRDMERVDKHLAGIDEKK